MTDITYYIGKISNMIVSVKPEYENGPESISGFHCEGFISGHEKSSITMYLNVKYDLMSADPSKAIGISIIDLVGNGANTEICNQGYGTTMFLSATSFVEDMLGTDLMYSGKISPVNDPDDEDGARDSHARRVHFWQKFGFKFKDPDSRYSSFRGVKTLRGPKFVFKKFQGPQFGFSHEEVMDLFPIDDTEKQVLERVQQELAFYLHNSETVRKAYNDAAPNPAQASLIDKLKSMITGKRLQLIDDREPLNLQLKPYQDIARENLKRLKQEHFEIIKRGVAANLFDKNEQSLILSLMFKF